VSLGRYIILNVNVPKVIHVRLEKRGGDRPKPTVRLKAMSVGGGMERGATAAVFT
jgi:hypothetical protein